MKLFHILFIILLCNTSCFSQGKLPPGTYTSTNKKAIKYYEEGKKYYETRKDQEAENFLNKALKEDPNFVEAHSAIAYLLMEKHREKEAMVHFQKAIDINPTFFPRNYFDLGLAQLLTTNYDGAVINLERFLKFERINPNTKEQAEQYLKNAKFGSYAIKHPQPFTPFNLGPAVNTFQHEYFPALTADGKIFMFTRNTRLNDDTRTHEQEDFYISYKSNNQWQPSLPITSVNTAGNEGAPTLSADGQFMFFAKNF